MSRSVPLPAPFLGAALAGAAGAVVVFALSGCAGPTLGSPRAPVDASPGVVETPESRASEATVVRVDDSVVVAAPPAPDEAQHTATDAAARWEHQAAEPDTAQTGPAPSAAASERVRISACGRGFLIH